MSVHTNTIKTYTEAGMISLSEQRKLAVSKYVIRSLSVTNSVTEEMFIDSNRDYPKRSQIYLLFSQYKIIHMILLVTVTLID